MIDIFSARNFKSLRDVRVELGQFTVFVGPNGSGKSSVLQALNGFCRILDNPKQAVNDGEINEALSRGAKSPVELTGRVKGVCYRVRSHSQPAIEQAPDFNSTKWEPVFNSNLQLPKAVLLRLTAQNLTSTSFDPSGNSTMAPDGTGLHAALASMALNEPESWQIFQRDLNEIIPTIRRLRHSKMTSGKVPALQFDTVGADSLPADQMSEGSLMILGLLTALYAPDRPNLILLDDLDRGLHPKAQKDLITLLRRFLERSPDLQLVATTHSPYLLTWISPNEVRMTCLREDGSTACAPIDTHPQFKKWKDEMAPGEMWSLFGEKWLIEPGAAA
jgi:predicted ATPase